jgi:hypothetical protein
LSNQDPNFSQTFHVFHTNFTLLQIAFKTVAQTRNQKNKTFLTETHRASIFDAHRGVNSMCAKLLHAQLAASLRPQRCEVRLCKWFRREWRLETASDLSSSFLHPASIVLLICGDFDVYPNS